MCPRNLCPRNLRNLILVYNEPCGLNLKMDVTLKARKKQFKKEQHNVRTIKYSS